MNILLTGGSGKLGSAIRKSGLFPELLAPTHAELDISDERAVNDYFATHEFKSIIHAAALVNMQKPEKDPSEAIASNIIGTANLARATLKKDRNMRFIHISTDQLYGGTKSNSKETDPLIPHNKYAWTKLGAECSARLLPNACLIRTAFFDPENIPFDESPDDMYSSKLPVQELAKNIFTVYSSNLVGVINIGSKRMSSYERFVVFKPSLKKIKFADVERQMPDVHIARDTSLDSTKWEQWLKNHQ